MSTDALRRLDRLEAFLREDAGNPLLLADAFETALRAGALDRAELHLRQGVALGVEADAWTLREAHWLLAVHRWGEARERLLRLAAAGDEAAADAGATARAAAIAGDLAYVDLRLGEHAAGIERLAPRLEGASAPLAAPIEATWLRLLHHAKALERGMAWLARREAQGPLEPSVAGVASLLALDHADYESSLRWATGSLAGESPPIEAAVARATLALAERRPDLARALLAPVLARHPDDGRSWSALGFTALLEQELAAARTAFDRALAAMPGHVGTWHGLGWTAIAQGDLGAARMAFEHALELDRNFAESHGGMAVVAAMAGDADAARQSIGRALGLDRACLSARYAEALLAGGARDGRAIFRLAERLLRGKRTPLGADMLDVVVAGERPADAAEADPPEHGV